MIAELEFVEHLDKIHNKLVVAPVDDDPTKIYTRAMIRDIKSEYQAKIEEFEKWAQEESQKEALPEWGTVVSPSSKKPIQAHPGAFPGQESE